MTRKSMMFGAAAALSMAAVALTSANAGTKAASHETAIEACSAVNPLQPVEALGAVEDGSGIGFSLVWLTDAKDNLWMCDADDTGAVYSYSLVVDDLLQGEGPELIGFQNVDLSEENPQEIAEKVCVAYVDGGSLFSSAADGLSDDPGYIVFVEDTDSNLYLCNATGDAMMWAFEPIGDPLSFDGEEIS